MDDILGAAHTNSTLKAEIPRDRIDALVDVDVLSFMTVDCAETAPAKMPSLESSDDAKKDSDSDESEVDDMAMLIAELMAEQRQNRKLTSALITALFAVCEKLKLNGNLLALSAALKEFGDMTFVPQLSEAMKRERMEGSFSAELTSSTVAMSAMALSPSSGNMSEDASISALSAPLSAPLAGSAEAALSAQVSAPLSAPMAIITSVSGVNQGQDIDVEHGQNSNRSASKGKGDGHSTHRKPRVRSRRGIVKLGQHREPIIIDDDDDVHRQTVRDCIVVANLESVLGKRKPARNVTGQPVKKQKM